MDTAIGNTQTGKESPLEGKSRSIIAVRVRVHGKLSELTISIARASLGKFCNRMIMFDDEPVDITRAFSLLTVDEQ
jgi:hypothetical protein